MAEFPPSLQSWNFLSLSLYVCLTFAPSSHSMFNARQCRPISTANFVFEFYLEAYPIIIIITNSHTRNKSSVGIEKISLRSLNETIWWMTNSSSPGSFFFTTRDLLLMILSTGWSFSGSIFLIWSTLCRSFWLVTSDTFLLHCQIIAALMGIYEA